MEYDVIASEQYSAKKYLLFCLFEAFLSHPLL